jgi:hypothetical protein
LYISAWILFNKDKKADCFFQKERLSTKNINVKNAFFSQLTFAYTQRRPNSVFRWSNSSFIKHIGYTLQLGSPSYLTPFCVVWMFALSFFLSFFLSLLSFVYIYVYVFGYWCAFCSLSLHLFISLSLCFVLF